jgi:uncharacterized protein (DUF1015 family)
MPRFEPFRGIRYDTGRVDLAEVTAPPYDVIDPDERAVLAARSPYNVVAVDCPVPDPAADCYAAAAARFHDWRHGGVLTVDEEATFSLYRMSFTGDDGTPRQTTGVIGGLGLERPGDGDVLPHEHTTPKARSDRLQLLQATRANLSAVWCLSLAAGLSKHLDPAGAPPLGDWLDDDGTRHELWRIDDPATIDAIREAVAGAPVVIADGHHRFETCLAYRAERRADAGDAAGPYDLTMALVVELVDEQLTVRPIHRLLSGLPSGTDVAAALGRAYDVGPLVAERPAAPALVERHGFRTLRPRRVSSAPDSVQLDEALTALPPHDVTFQHGADNVERAVAAGAADAGVLLRAVTVDQIAEVARRRDRMPPKTTFFWPKPRSGLVFRSLD